MTTLDAARIERLFTRADGFGFAKWTKPIVPAVIGLGGNGAEVFTDSVAAAAELVGLSIGGTDPEFGANLLVFFCNDWAELTQLPGMDKMVPDLPGLLNRLTQAKANQYRIFRFDTERGIKMAMILLRYDEDLQSVPATVLAVGQAIRTLLLWAEDAFADESPVSTNDQGGPALKRWCAELLRAAYDPTIPAYASDPALALRLAARVAAT